MVSSLFRPCKPKPAGSGTRSRILMKDLALQLHHRLPAPARSVTASLRGMYLRSWRCGPETQQLVSEALEPEYWSRERLEAWRTERSSYVLNRTATQARYYTEPWRRRRRSV